MKLETIKKRLSKDRPMVSVTLWMPEDVVNDLKNVAPLKGLGIRGCCVRMSALDCARI